MLCARVIPVVLLDGYSVLKTIQFKTRRNLGNPITVARIYNSRNVDELILLDIDAAKQGRHIDFPTIEDVASECFMPLAVGGGLQTPEHVEEALKRGADKVVVNSIALSSPAMVKTLSRNFGSQCIVVSIDVLCQGPGNYEIFSHAGIPVKVKDPILFCKTVEELGAGEIFINSVDRDGAMNGFDLDLIRAAASSVRVPVIACGGAGHPDDFTRGIQAGASACAAASIFHFTDFTPQDCRSAMRAQGIPVRP